MSHFNELTRLGMFMVTGLPFLSQVIKYSEYNKDIDDAINQLINDMQKINITIDIIEDYISISYKGKFVCKVNINDYISIDTNNSMEI